MTTCAVLIVAGGSGRRFGADKPKQYALIAGAPLLRHTVAAFRAHPGVSSVHVVIQPEHRADYEAAVAGLGLPEPFIGGPTRQDSVLNGLEGLAALPAPPDLALIHDAARPCVTATLIDGVITALAQTPGAIPALPVVDSLKCGDPDGALVVAARSRDNLWRAQTPQGFRFADILAAHRRFHGQALTDDAAVAESAGLAVALTPGDEENIKVTTSDDLARVTQTLAPAAAVSPAAAPTVPAMEPRAGTGFDVHRFVEHDTFDDHFITLCGVPVAHTARLEGHSDADVGLHALTDALLGAIADGDIGSHFPPTDPQWRGADSARFVAHAAERVRALGGKIAHVDITVICERPKVGPHRDAMRARVAEILGISLGRVSVKATTTEKLGFTGRGEGIAAQAVAAVLLPAPADE
jgi:2-C-methyl-D-erythritol 4-phosphate cytidylyltransferase / 2-C-methyl-D-erythritol 2,4-cyclodiphosphate synthase